MGLSGSLSSGVAISATVGPACAASGASCVEVEAVDARRVAGEQLLELDRVGVVEQLAQVLARVRRGALVVRVVAPPHEVVEADLVARGRVFLAGLAHADVAALREVLGREPRQLVLVGVRELTGAAGLADLVDAPRRGGAASAGSTRSPARS